MVQKLHVKVREATGRKVAALRRGGVLPGVVYGHDMESTSVELNPSEFRKVYRNAGTSALIDLQIDEGTSFKALIQDVQVHILHMHPTHVDLRCINMKEEIVVDVPLEYIGESPAVKDLSGTMVRNVHEVAVRCLPADLPSHLEVDISTLVTFDDVIVMKTLILPKGVTVDLDPEAVIASVSAPLTDEQLKKMEEEADADVSTVEVEGEKKEGEEAAEADAKEGNASEEKKSESSES